MRSLRIMKLCWRRTGRTETLKQRWNESISARAVRPAAAGGALRAGDECGLKELPSSTSHERGSLEYQLDSSDESTFPFFQVCSAMFEDASFAKHSQRVNAEVAFTAVPCYRVPDPHAEGNTLWNCLH